VVQIRFRLVVTFLVWQPVKQPSPPLSATFRLGCRFLNATIAAVVTFLWSKKKRKERKRKEIKQVPVVPERSIFPP